MKPFLLILCCLSAGPLVAQSWNQWRGPDRDGSFPQFQEPTRWPDAPKQLWQVEVGAGYGSPAIAGERAYLLIGQGDREVVSCRDLKTGKEVWRHDYPISFVANPYATSYGNGPFTTPLVSEGRVFTVGVTGRVVCTDSNSGKELWHADFDGKLDDKRSLFCGNSVSPILVGDTVVVHVGNEKRGRMTAYDVATGRQKWLWEEEVPGYASPILARFQGEQQLVFLTQNRCVGFDPNNGTALWSYPWKVQWRENIVNPIALGNGVILSGRENGETIALNIHKKRATWQAEKVWSNNEIVMYTASPVLIGSKLYGLSNKGKGTFFCLDGLTGKTLWKSEGRQGASAQIVVTQSYLLFLNTEARLVMLDPAADGYRPIKSYELAPRGTWAYPAMLTDGLLLKDATHLTRFRFSNTSAQVP